MRIMSLKQFVAQQTREESPEPQGDNAPDKIVVSIRELIDGIENFEDDRRVEITIGYPETDSICVKFFGHDFTYLGD